MLNLQNRGMRRDTRNQRKAVRTSLRLNQMPLDWTTIMMQQADWARDLQQGLAGLCAMATGAVSASQAQTGGLVELMGRSIRVKAALLEQATAAAQAPNLAESQARWMGFWNAAFRLAHSNAQGLARINGTALESWLRLGGASHS